MQDMNMVLISWIVILRKRRIDTDHLRDSVYVRTVLASFRGHVFLLVRVQGTVRMPVQGLN